MIMPDDPAELIDPLTPDFRVEGWQRHFGRYQWYYVVGANRLLTSAGITRHKDVKALARNVAVPAAWKALPEYDPHFTWEQAENQIDRALHRQAQTFDRACMAIVTIVAAVERNGKASFRQQHANTNVRDWLRIKPAYFQILDFPGTPGASGTPVPSIHQGPFLMASRQSKRKFLDDISKGCGATHGTLKLAGEYLKNNKLHHTDEVTVMNRRTQNAKRASDEEVWFEI